MTVSHIGVGDITSNTTSERAFNCFTILIGTFSYAILFGNMTSIVLDFASRLKSKLTENYKYVNDFIEKKHIGKIY